MPPNKRQLCHGSYHLEHDPVINPAQNQEGISFTQRAGIESPHTELTEVSVSQWSKFSDPVWILSRKRSIYWSRLPKRSATIDQVAFERLMRPLKVIAYLLLTEEGLGPATTHYLICSMKEFAAWMLSRPVPLRHYRDATGSTLNEYFEHLSKCNNLNPKKGKTGDHAKLLSSDSLQRKAQAVGRLYNYRDRLEDALQTISFNPPGNPSPEKYQSDNFWAAKTPPIPDEQHQELLGAALVFIRDNAEETISSLRSLIEEEKIIQIKEALDTQPIGEVADKSIERFAKSIRKALPHFKRGKLIRSQTRTLLSVINLAEKANVPLNFCIASLVKDKNLNMLFRSRRKWLGDSIDWEECDLYRRLRLLQISCFIIIATSTGMRLSELLALKPGCVIKRKIKGHEGFLFWLRSTLTKTSPNITGENAFWLCGELSARAIRILEQLHILLPSTLTPKQNGDVPLTDSLFRAYSWNAIILEARAMSDGALYKWLNFFIKELKLNVGHIHPHQFRRTFARNAVRWGNVPILALKRHFKHCSLLMTDYYIGVDDELMKLFFEEHREASRERLRQILAGECGGPGGLILQKRLMKMADNEELPMNFRGKEHAGTMDDLVNEMCEEGFIAYKCGEFTTCLYVPGLAKCGEDGPKEHECHPTECPNSYILLEDVPFYLMNIRQNRLALGKLSVRDKAGPLGRFYLRRIRNDQVAIQPLAVLYSEKLQRLKNHYEQLNEVEKASDYGSVLKNRIELDSATLEPLLQK